MERDKLEPDIFAVGTTLVGVILIPDVACGRRHAEAVAVARVLRALAGPEVSIGHDRDGAPLLAGADGFVSVSHSPAAAAVAIDSVAPVGIDIESCARVRQLERVAPRVMTAGEIAVYGDVEHGPVRAWTIKEALYKVAGEPGIDWRSGLVLPSPLNNTHARAGAHACDVVYSALYGDDWLTVVRRIGF